MVFRSFVGLTAFLALSFAWAQSPVLEGITFAGDPDSVYVPARPLAKGLGLPIEFDVKANSVRLGGQDFPSDRTLYDNTKLILLRDLENVGVTMSWTPANRIVTAILNDKSVQIHVGSKRLTVDLSTQQLEAYEGDFLVFSSHVSTGKEGKRTPAGEYIVGPKSRIHYSKLYNNAPMPWSVQINGNIFIHGYKSVPKRPASHGCIRMPITAAHWLYRWVETGMPASITGEWSDKP
jgi:lipoprotein-anchoring transpeptidase ErfK/SrfK